MIKINLLVPERKVATARKSFSFQSGQKITIGCSVLLIAAGLFVGWRYWAVTHESANLDQEISAAQKEAVRLQSIITQVQQFEQRKGQLQQRVTLIEQLRKDQNGPVHMLDQISRALPPMLWLTELKQTPANPNEVVINGKCTTLTALTDFVGSLEASGYFKKSVEIVNSQTETGTAPAGELVSFSLRALFQRPGEPTRPVSPRPAAGGAAAPVAPRPAVGGAAAPVAPAPGGAQGQLKKAGGDPDRAG
jgi:type IV pilus assembly protein PilN